MNFITVVSFLTISISASFIHENLDFLKTGNFEKRHALTAEQVLADGNNINLLNEMVEYKPDFYFA